jgi:Arc/MetJ family transcription regulator
MHLDEPIHLIHIGCMKRTNVVLDEDLLEKARRVTGEKTYSGAISKALEEYIRRHDLVRALAEFEAEARKGDFFWPGYLEEIRPHAYSVMEAKKRRISADEKRVPRKKVRKRAAR